MLAYSDLLDIGLSPDAETLQARLVAAAGQLGFGLSAGALIRGRLASRKASVHSFGNPPAGFVEASKSLDVGLKDPLLTSMMAGPGVFTYDQSFYTAAGAGELWENQSPFGYRSGMAVAMHEPSHAEVFFFGVDGPDALPFDSDARIRLEGGLRVLALHAHAASKRLHTPAPDVDLNALDSEEVTALKWAADSQAFWLHEGRFVVSSPGRVKAQRRAQAKLRAASGAEAVLRAIDGGLIDR
ncbi:MAG: hypothetical protein EOP39_04255 [Rubrivivax sp.]|nr:MAG: hypothetical protein EOP39_04255 [Rubrivivax sp.]